MDQFYQKKRDIELWKTYGAQFALADLGEASMCSAMPTCLAPHEGGCASPCVLTLSHNAMCNKMACCSF